MRQRKRHELCPTDNQRTDSRVGLRAFRRPEAAGPQLGYDKTGHANVFDPATPHVEDIADNTRELLSQIGSDEEDAFEGIVPVLVRPAHQLTGEFAFHDVGGHHCGKTPAPTLNVVVDRRTGNPQSLRDFRDRESVEAGDTRHLDRSLKDVSFSQHGCLHATALPAKLARAAHLLHSAPPETRPASDARLRPGDR